MALRSSAIAISELSSCIICLFLLNYKILHPELPCRECGHSDYFVPKFVLPSNYATVSARANLLKYPQPLSPFVPLLAFVTEASPILQALIATFFTWSLTAVGAAFVFGMKNFNLDAMLGFAAGVMLSASFWSLLVPAIDLAALQQEENQIPSWFPSQ